MDMGHFQVWTETVGVPWNVIKPHLEDVMEKLRSLWLNYFHNSPMNEDHNVSLREHGGKLQDVFRIQ